MLVEYLGGATEEHGLTKGQLYEVSEYNTKSKSYWVFNDFYIRVWMFAFNFETVSEGIELWES